MFKMDFQDGGYDGHLGFPIRTILATLDLKITLILPTKFQVYWSLFMSNIYFQDGSCGGHLGFPIRTILATCIFDLQIAPILPTNFVSIGLSVQEKCKIDFQDGHHGGHLRFLI